MKAKELRIGNWVSINPDYLEGDKLNPFKITCIDEENGVLVSGIEVGFDWDNMIPIPLTPEILEKAGFEDYYKEDRYELNGYCYYDGCLWFGTSSIELEYLHQLQNLYFALTGEELEINFSE